MTTFTRLTETKTWLKKKNKTKLISDISCKTTKYLDKKEAKFVFFVLFMAYSQLIKESRGLSVLGSTKPGLLTFWRCSHLFWADALHLVVKWSISALDFDTHQPWPGILILTNSSSMIAIDTKHHSLNVIMVTGSWICLLSSPFACFTRVK